MLQLQINLIQEAHSIGSIYTIGLMPVNSKVFVYSVNVYVLLFSAGVRMVALCLQ